MMRRFIILALMSTLSFGANKHSGRRAPGFSLPDSRFTRYDLQDFRGKWVLIDFMLTSCPHCTELAKTLENVKRTHGDRVVILEIVLPPDTTDTVARYIEEYKISVPVLFDQGQMAASYFNATPQNPSFDTPHLFIVNPEGMIVGDYGHDDEEQLEETKLMRELDALFKSKPQKPDQRSPARSPRSGGRRSDRGGGERSGAARAAADQSVRR
jgi:peroxiredoxin